MSVRIHRRRKDPPPFLLLGRVLRPHGVRGELRVEIITAYPERVVEGRRVYLGTDPQEANTAEARRVTHARRHQQYLILELEGITDRNTAELYRDHYVMVALEDAVPLEEGEFYLFQVLGIDVYTDEGEYLGQVSDVIETGANDVYVVHGPSGEVLLPDIEECILKVDIPEGRMTVHMMEGLRGE
jgi:16S rRNA processing protein RimM